MTNTFICVDSSFIVRLTTVEPSVTVYRPSCPARRSRTSGHSCMGSGRCRIEAYSSRWARSMR